MIRNRLQSGYGRKPISLTFGVGFGILLFAYWDHLLVRDIKPLEVVAKLAFLAVAFSVTAYNLRTRVVDLILKVDGTPTKTRVLATIARSCGKRLTNLVLLFTASAFMMGAGGFVPQGLRCSRHIAALVVTVFVISIVNFVYVLFTFERLERYMLDSAEERADKRESDRLLNGKVTAEHDINTDS